MISIRNLSELFYRRFITDWEHFLFRCTDVEAIRLLLHRILSYTLNLYFIETVLSLWTPDHANVNSIATITEATLLQ